VGTRLGWPLLVAVALLAAGCDEPAGTATPEKSSESEARLTSLTVDQAEIDEWEPVYADVRLASRAEVSALDERVAAAADGSYTLVYPDSEGVGIEVAHTGQHTRVHVTGYGGTLDLYLEVDPDDTDDGLLPGQRVVAVCIEEYEGCVDPNARSADGNPHLFDNFTDTLYFYGVLAAPSTASGFVQALQRPDVVRPVYGTAVVESSPYGSLDCLLLGPDKSTVLGSQGEPAFSSADLADPLVGGYVTSPVNSACVDSRGL